MSGEQPAPVKQLTLWGEPGVPGGDATQSQAQSKDGKTEKKKDAAASAAAPPKPPEPPPTYTYPFHIRYAAQMLDLTGFVDGHNYTAGQIKDLLVHNGYVEFQDVQPVFHHHQDTNTLIITIKGSTKGGARPLTRAVLAQAEMKFKGTFQAHGSEDRILVYRNARGEVAMVHPPADRSAAQVRCDLPLAVHTEGQLWDLVADLHSHHVLGAAWSPTDDANERLRGIVFGLFSWRGGQNTWLFRQWDGQKFVALSYGEVVADA